MFDIVELHKQFRPKTTIKYPPFKNGRYMEEFFYDYYVDFLKSNNTNDMNSLWTYIPIFWTNIQCHSGFIKMKEALSLILKDKLISYHSKNPNAKYFTIVQHDDGILLDIPKLIRDRLMIFGGCTGDIPLPLIYEDTENTLNKYKSTNCPKISKEFLATFIGSETHPIRKMMMDKLHGNNPRIGINSSKTWTNSVSDSASDKFLDMTLKSEFCLAPRGYGRSSFRFFEAIQLDIIPVYIWDDKEWLPYKDIIDYNKFSISINIKDIGKLNQILESISNNPDKYKDMLEELKEHNMKKTFSLEFMAKYIINNILNCK
jgi:hypothetical protein